MTDFALTEPMFDDSAPKFAPIDPMPQTRGMKRLGSKIPQGIYLGTSSWNFPGWRGLVWSPRSGEKELSDRGLSAYAKHPVLRTVGIDRGYYQPLSAGRLKNYADQVPENFRFLIKAPQIVTDPVLRDKHGRAAKANPDYLSVQKAIELFVEPVVNGLGEKAGPLVFEFSALPRQAISDIDKRRQEIDRYAQFFTLLKESLAGENLLIASEMRTARFLTRTYVDCLRPTGVRPVVSLNPHMPDIRRQIEMLRYFDAPDIDSGLWTAKGDIIVRWSVAAGGTYRSLKEAWKPFDRIRRADIVTREGIAWLMKLAVKSGVRGFAVANNKAEGCAPLTMRAIAERITDFSPADVDHEVLPLQNAGGK